MVHNNSYKIASVSLIIYILLFGSATYQYAKHQLMRMEGKGGKYINMKLRFFAILAVSALLDMPTYIACIQLNGPYQCEWYTGSYIAFWVMHLVALCGYVTILVIPPLLWDDIINGREGKFLFEEWPRDRARLVFCGCSIIFFISDIYAIVCAIFFTNINSHDNYYENDGTGAMASQLAVMMESFSIFLLAIACLFYGIKLQLHVMKTGIETRVLRRLLIQLNIVLAIVVICYLTRALLIITLFNGTPDSYTAALGNIKDYYGWWVLLTRWLPHVFCSFCLLHIMSRNSSSVRSNNCGGAGVSVVDDEAWPQNWSCEAPLLSGYEGVDPELSNIIGASMSNKVGSADEVDDTRSWFISTMIKKMNWATPNERSPRESHSNLIPGMNKSKDSHPHEFLDHFNGISPLLDSWDVAASIANHIPVLKERNLDYTLPEDESEGTSNDRQMSMSTTSNGSDVSESGLYLNVI